MTVPVVWASAATGATSIAQTSNAFAVISKGSGSGWICDALVKQYVYNGHAQARRLSNQTANLNKIFMTDNFESPPRDTLPPARPHSTGKTGVMLGVLVVALAALAFYFYWRNTGAIGEDGKRPAPAVSQ